jgi:integrase
MAFHRTTFTEQDRARIVSDGPRPDHRRRDRIALTLLLKYGLRKQALLTIQAKHFDRSRRRLTVFTKGGKIRDLPIVDDWLWEDLLSLELEPHHYLLCRQQSMFRGYNLKTGDPITALHQYPEKPMGHNGAHKWWYGCLQRAGIVAPGVEHGERMHKARHTAGQVLLDKTKGNLKATQKLLGHASIKTTGDIYTDWDVDQLAETLMEVG